MPVNPIQVMMQRTHQQREYRRQVDYLARMRAPESSILSRRCCAAARLVLIVTLAAIAGCALIAATLHGGERTARRMRVTATAYCAGPCSVCQTTGITSTGRNAYSRGVAVDPKVIQIGARIDVPGHGAWLPADDVGGDIKGDAIDVRFDTHDEARAWGRRVIMVRVWE
jgi:3D (Asp-Asp-Asp) domain-containing protein